MHHREGQHRCAQLRNTKSYWSISVASTKALTHYAVCTATTLFDTYELRYLNSYHKNIVLSFSQIDGYHEDIITCPPLTINIYVNVLSTDFIGSISTQSVRVTGLGIKIDMNITSKVIAGLG